MTHANPNGLRQGVNIFLILTFLTVLEFIVAVGPGDLLMLVVLAAIKAGLVVWYYMGIHRLGEEEHGEHDHHSYAFKTANNRFGLWLFILSDAFLFAGLLVARFNLLGFTRPYLHQDLGLLVTAVLLVSSFFMNRAEVQMSLGNVKGFITNTTITLVLGIAFLIGVVGAEWQIAAQEGITPSSGPAGAIFYMMTGMHAFHVLTGVIFLIVVLRNGMKGLYTAEKHWAVEAAAVYWHFIDVVWIFFYPALYLIGIAIH
jgi:cytochrome c oxidase subunit III